MTRTFKSPVAAIAAVLTIAPAASAGDILNYSFDSLDGTPSFQASGISGSVFDRDGDHFISYSTLTGNPAPAAISNGWDTTGFSSGYYYTFSVTASTSIIWNSVRLDLQASPSSAGSDAPTHFAIRSSVDGFSTDLAAGLLTSSFTTEYADQHINATGGTSVEYRVYAWGTSSAGATVAVDRVAVSTVPEPASAPLVALGLAAAAGITAINRRSCRVS